MKLFEKLKFGDNLLANRIVLAPLTRSRAGAARLPNALMAEYYAQRADAGLLISEATSISVQGLGFLNNPGIYTDEQAQAWQLTTKAVHDQGGKIFLQLWHCGRASHTSFHPETGLPVAPSAIILNGDYIHTPSGKQAYETPRALETAEVKQIVLDYQSAARRAKVAGFDGIEIHAANGYLIDEFLQSKTNQRSDEYGGSIENRTRFLLEILAAVKQVWDADKIGVRLSPNGVFNDMGSEDYREQFLYTAQELAKHELAYLHVMDGLAFGFHGLGEPITLAELKKVYPGCIIGNCGYTKELAEQRLQDGDADLIAFGRPFISNPDLVVRFQHNLELNADAEMDVWYADIGAKGYTDFPTVTLAA
ncbi:alkene reductase [Methylomonas sp. AM2-LC]|uniref:alkene reductase n=1 Tax=Methylomonas sp. AM2-LC TaxID=3153301 RepID=UPI003266523A